MKTPISGDGESQVSHAALWPEPLHGKPTRVWGGLACPGRTQVQPRNAHGARRRRVQFRALAADVAAGDDQARRRRATTSPARPRPSSARDIGSGTGFTGLPSSVAETMI